MLRGSRGWLVDCLEKDQASNSLGGREQQRLRRQALGLGVRVRSNPERSTAADPRASSRQAIKTIFGIVWENYCNLF